MEEFLQALSNQSFADLLALLGFILLLLFAFKVAQNVISVEVSEDDE